MKPIDAAVAGRMRRTPSGGRLGGWRLRRVVAALGATVIVVVGLVLIAQQSHDAASPPILLLSEREPSPRQRSAVWCPLLPLALRTLLPEEAGHTYRVLDGSPASSILRDLRELDSGSLLPLEGVAVEVCHGSGPWIAVIGKRGINAEVLSVLGDLASRQQSISVRASFSMVIAFNAEFEELGEPIKFVSGMGASVGLSCLGFGWPSPPVSLSGGTPAEFVSVLFRNRSEFGISIESRSGDEIVLASVEHRGSLAKTWDHVDELSRMGTKTPISQLEGARRFSVPQIRLAAAREFPELAGAVVESGGGRRTQLEKVLQKIEFQLDRHGARVVSSASLRALQGDQHPEPVDFVFDRPFLVALRRRSIDRPYFLLWIADTDVLVPFAANTNESESSAAPRGTR